MFTPDRLPLKAYRRSPIRVDVSVNGTQAFNEEFQEPTDPNISIGTQERTTILEKKPQKQISENDESLTNSRVYVKPAFDGYHQIRLSEKDTHFENFSQVHIFE